VPVVALTGERCTIHRQIAYLWNLRMLQSWHLRESDMSVLYRNVAVAQKTQANYGETALIPFAIFE
jgi:hypothetical protein